MIIVETRSGPIALQKAQRVNEEINAPVVRLVGLDGEQLGVMSVRAALALADEAGVDLVEIAPMAQPPVCRMMDFGQFKYELTKKQKEAKKKQKVIKLKEVKVRPKTDEGDLQTKCNRIRDFLGDGDKVKVSVFFKGRERAHMEIGFKVVERMKVILGEEAGIEKDAAIEGNTITMILQNPKKK